MDTQITFTLGDVGMFVLWGLGVAVLLLLTMILFRAYLILREANRIMSDNKPNIDKILDEAPGITKNINIITGEVAHGTEAFRDTVDNIADTTGSVTGAIRDNSDVVDSISRVFSVLNTVKSGLDKLFAKKNAGAGKPESQPGKSSDDLRPSSPPDFSEPKAGTDTVSDKSPSGIDMEAWDNLKATTEGIAEAMGKKSGSDDDKKNP